MSSQEVLTSLYCCGSLPCSHKFLHSMRKETESDHYNTWLVKTRAGSSRIIANKKSDAFVLKAQRTIEYCCQHTRLKEGVAVNTSAHQNGSNLTYDDLEVPQKRETSMRSR